MPKSCVYINDRFKRKFLSIIILVFFLSRFIYLLADFPISINWSGDLYTDEGWYSSGAVRFLISNKWIVPGDFNPVINLPVFQIIVFLGFKLIGLSILSARLVALVFFTILIVNTFVLVKSEWGNLPALASIAFVCSDFSIFAYSRLAFLEIPMLTFVLFAFLSYKSLKPPIFQVIFAGVFMLLGMLTKTTAIFALPAFLFLIWTEKTPLKNKISLATSFSLTLFVPYIIYWLFTSNLFQQDVKYFSFINFTKRITPQLQMIINNLFSFFVDVTVLRSPIFWLATFSLLLILLLDRQWYRDRWLVVIILLLIFYIGLLSITNYHPPRYFIPFLFLVCLFCGITLGKVIDMRQSSHFRYAILIGIIFVLTINGSLIARYLTSPKFSFINMINHVTEKISSPDHRDNPIIIGSFANTISLNSGIPSINSILGTWTIQEKMKVYQPRYFLSLGDDDLIDNLSNQYLFTPIGEYRVFENYYTGSNVILYKITKRH